MKKISVLLVALIVVGTSFAQSTWKVDNAHAKLGFSITHLLISEVEGSFKSFDATIVSNKEDFSDATIKLTADVSTINTDDEKRDGHLKSEDFFDVAKYPSITFKSSSFKKIDVKKYTLEGMLTMHGVSKPVVLDVTYNGTIIHPYNKKSVAGFKVTGKVKRSDFNLGAKYGSPVLGDEVELIGKMEFVKE